MSKIRSIEAVKEKLQIGKSECCYVWSLDGQTKLKGNSLKAFETSLKTICNFEKTKEGRKTYYLIKEIYEENLPREHKNKSSLKGNKNRKNKIGFNRDSDVEFVAAVLVNKIEYFTRHGERDFKSITSWMHVCGLFSEEDKVNIRIYGILKRAINTLEKLRLIGVEEQYMACIYGKFFRISKVDYDEYMEKSKECIKKVLGEDLSKRYRSYYTFKKFYKGNDKNELEEEYMKLMNSDIQYVYTSYRLFDTLDKDKNENEVYMRLLDVVFGKDAYLQMETETVNERIQGFVERLEFYVCSDKDRTNPYEMKYGFGN